MLDIGWSELAVVAVVALIVIGPKDLPRAMATMGKWIGKARRLAGEFQSQVNEIIRDSEVEEVAKEVNKIGRVNIDESLRKTVDPDGSLRKGLEFEYDERDIFEPKDAPKAEEPPKPNKEA